MTVRFIKQCEKAHDIIKEEIPIYSKIDALKRLGFSECEARQLIFSYASDKIMESKRIV